MERSRLNELLPQVGVVLMDNEVFVKTCKCGVFALSLLEICSKRVFVRLVKEAFKPKFLDF